MIKKELEDKRKQVLMSSEVQNFAYYTYYSKSFIELYLFMAIRRPYYR